MYPVSSQRRYWTFSSEAEIAALRLKHNQEFIEKHGSIYDVSIAILSHVYIILYLLPQCSTGITTAPILSNTRRGTNSAEKLRTSHA